MNRRNFRDKIFWPQDLLPRIESHKTTDSTIVYCHGCFDIFHRAHIYQFEQALAQGDILVVGLTTDRYVLKGPDRPVFNQNIRAEVIAALEMVDYVVFSDFKMAVDLIKFLRPDVYVKGRSNFSIPDEVAAIESVGGRIFFSEEMPIHSSDLFKYLPKKETRR